MRVSEVSISDQHKSMLVRAGVLDLIGEALLLDFSDKYPGMRQATSIKEAFLEIVFNLSLHALPDLPSSGTMSWSASLAALRPRERRIAQGGDTCPKRSV